MHTIGQIKVEKYLQQIVKSLPFSFVEKNPLSYETTMYQTVCSVEYQTKKKLFAQIYTLTITLDFPCESTEHIEATYNFSKDQWQSKSNEVIPLEKKFCVNWKYVDFYKIMYSQKEKKGTLQLSLIPGSYTILIFPQ